MKKKFTILRELIDSAEILFRPSVAIAIHAQIAQGLESRANSIIRKVRNAGKHWEDMMNRVVSGDRQFQSFPTHSRVQKMAHPAPLLDMVGGKSNYL